MPGQKRAKKQKNKEIADLQTMALRGQDRRAEETKETEIGMIGSNGECEA
ncbi:hypothetical protein AVEN_58643-1, partial [Araneus ventricosus]